MKMSEAEQRDVLWKMLDDIDTAMDMMKPDMTRAFNQWLSRKLQERFKVYDPDEAAG